MKTIDQQIADAMEDLADLHTRYAKWDDRHAAAELGSYEAEVASRMADNYARDIRETKQEIARLRAQK